MIIPDRMASVNPFSQTFSKTLRISMIIAKEGHMPFTLSPQQRADLPPIQRLAAGGEKRLISGREKWPPSAAGGTPCPRRGAKGGKGTVWFPCPLLTPPNPPLRRDSLRSRSETGGTGLGSGRLSAYMWLSCPEFSLRKAPRMTVRGQTVQGVRTIAAKSSASINGVLLERQTPLWAPRI